MKKLLFILAVAAMTLTACVKDKELPVPQGTEAKKPVDRAAYDTTAATR